MISDGFGSELTVLERIEQLDRLNTLRARERSNTRAELEDLLQEARITVWRVATAHPDKPREYLSAAASMRITEAATRQTWTGHTRVHGQPTDPLRTSTDSLDVEGVSDWIEYALALPGVEDQAVLAYHDGQIAAAIASLPPKQRAYILLRFWGGYTPAEIEREFHIDKDAAWRDARRNLVRGLGHLVHA